MKFCYINVKKINNLVFKSYAILRSNPFENDKCRHLSVSKQFLLVYLYKERNFRYDFQLGSVAGPVIQATGRLESEDGLRTGVLLHMGSR